MPDVDRVAATVPVSSADSDLKIPVQFLSLIAKPDAGAAREFFPSVEENRRVLMAYPPMPYFCRAARRHWLDCRSLRVIQAEYRPRSARITDRRRTNCHRRVSAPRACRNHRLLNRSPRHRPVRPCHSPPRLKSPQTLHRQANDNSRTLFLRIVAIGSRVREGLIRPKNSPLGCSCSRTLKFAA